MKITAAIRRRLFYWPEDEQAPTCAPCRLFLDLPRLGVSSIARNTKSAIFIWSGQTRDAALFYRNAQSDVITAFFALLTRWRQRGVAKALNPNGRTGTLSAPPLQTGAQFTGGRAKLSPGVKMSFALLDVGMV